MAMSRSLAGTVVTLRSPMWIVPSSTGSSPASIRSVVDLPHPDGPTSTRNSPSAISRSRWSTAVEAGVGAGRTGERDRGHRPECTWSALGRRDGRGEADETRNGPGRATGPPIASTVVSDRITTEDVAQVARLARLELTAEEIERTTAQLAPCSTTSPTSTRSTSPTSSR